MYIYIYTKHQKIVGIQKSDLGFFLFFPHCLGYLDEGS